MDPRPNVVIFLADDLGFSDLGCYGGEIRTPNLDRLAERGVRLANFHNTPRCSPSRASLLTGLHPHQTGIGILAIDDRSDGGYEGKLNDRCVTIAEVLRSAGYATAVRGKWHLTNSVATPDDAWPTARGFDTFYGTLTGCGSYYQPGTLTRDQANVEHEADDPDFFYTDRIADETVSFLTDHHDSTGGEQPFFLYVPFTAPHWPLHARPDTIAGYDGVYDVGWDVIRQERFDRQKKLGVIAEHTSLSSRDASIPAWDEEPYPMWQTRRMQVYAAMVEEMDQAIGRIVDQIEAQGSLDNTVILFMSDNGAAAEPVPLIEYEHFRERTDILRHRTRTGEEVSIGNDPLVVPGPENTYSSYGKGWASVSNSPFRLYKIWAHEGGVSSPFIAHWPAGGLASGNVIDSPYQLVDVMPTILEATSAPYPEARDNIPVHSPAGTSMLPTLRGRDGGTGTLWWEHCGNAAIQRGRWKLVRQHDWPWELYDVSTDRSETNDLAAAYPDVVQDLSREWERLAERHGVIPFRRTLDIYRRRGLGWNYAIG